MPNRPPNDGDADRITVATSDTVIAIARPTRKRITIVNRDATNFVDINVNGAAVGGSHFQVKAGESLVLHTTASINGIADTASVIVHIIDEFYS